METFLMIDWAEGVVDALPQVRQKSWVCHLRCISHRPPPPSCCGRRSMTPPDLRRHSFPGTSHPWTNHIPKVDIHACIFCISQTPYLRFNRCRCLLTSQSLFYMEAGTASTKRILIHYMMFLTAATQPASAEVYIDSHLTVG